MQENNPKTSSISESESGIAFSRRQLLRSTGVTVSALTVGTGSVLASSEDLVPVPAGLEVPKSHVREVPSADPPADMDDKKQRAKNRKPTVAEDESKINRDKVKDPFPGSTTNKYLSYGRDEYFTGKYHVMDATFTVPNEPPAGSNAGDSIMYYFPALINCDHDCYTTPKCIIQPVLQWNQKNTNYNYDWSLASWYGCGNDSSNFYHSTPISANSGDEIYGSMEYYPSLNQWYIYTENQTQGESTSIWSPTKYSNYSWDRAYCALESFYWEDGKCSHLPGDVTFNNIYMENANGNRVQPDWGENTANVNCELGCTVRNYDEIHIETPN